MYDDIILGVKLTIRGMEAVSAKGIEDSGLLNGPHRVPCHFWMVL